MDGWSWKHYDTSFNYSYSIYCETNAEYGGTTKTAFARFNNLWQANAYKDMVHQYLTHMNIVHKITVERDSRDRGELQNNNTACALMIQTGREITAGVIGLFLQDMDINEVFVQEEQAKEERSESRSYRDFTNYSYMAVTS